MSKPVKTKMMRMCCTFLAVWVFHVPGVLGFDRCFLHAEGPVQVPIIESPGWRVEEEFIGAIRGTEKIRRTDFYTGMQYMEFTGRSPSPQFKVEVQDLISFSSSREFRVQRLL
jgi:hypothetical protein